MRKAERYKILENVAIADIAFESYGNNYNELFENSALALFEMTAEIKTIKPIIKRTIYVEAGTIENLLYDFLSEILYLKDAEQLIFSKCKVDIKNENQKILLGADFFGDKINPETQILENDIKAVTMHMFKIEKTKEGYKATVVVDI